MPARTSDLYKSTSPGRTPSFNHTNIFGQIVGLDIINGLVPIANIVDVASGGKAGARRHTDRDRCVRIGKAGAALSQTI